MSFLREITIEGTDENLVIRQRRVGAWIAAFALFVIGLLWLTAVLHLPRELSFVCDRGAKECVLTRSGPLATNAIVHYPLAEIREIRVDEWITSRSGSEFALVADTSSGSVQLTPYGYEEERLEGERDRLAAVLAPQGPDHAGILDVRAIGFATLVPLLLLVLAIGLAALAPFVRIELDRRASVLSLRKRSPIHFSTRRELFAAISGVEIEERSFNGKPMYAAVVVVLAGGVRLTLCDAKDVPAQRDVLTRLREFLARSPSPSL